MIRKGVKQANIFIIAVLIILSVILALSSPFVFAAGSYEFAGRSDPGYTLVPVSDIIESYIGGQIDSAERDYLNAHDGFKLSYSDYIPISEVSVSGNDVLTVAAKSYNNGLNWTPIRVTHDGGEAERVGDLWTVTAGKSDSVTVEYSTKVTISASDMSGFINSAREAAINAKNKIREEEIRYKDKVAEYEQKLIEYDEYLKALKQYDGEMISYNEAYREYQVRYNVWARAKAEYDAYLEELAIYQKELDDYNNYDAILSKYYEDLAAYRQYLSDYEAYKEKLRQYEIDTASPDDQKVLYQLSVLDYMVKPVKNNRTLSGAILGDAVTQVLGNTEALVLAGADRAAVRRANDATIILRDLLRKYSELKSDEARYIYYINCHSELSNNFNELLRVLDYFYAFHAVRDQLTKRDKTENYEILLGQLYYICNALDDERVGNYIQVYKSSKDGAAYFDSSYRIGPNKRTPESVVGENGILPDSGDAQPLESGYPALPEKPVEPKAVDNPGAMPQQRMPVAPEEVVSPGKEPTSPTAPVKPTEIKKPTQPSVYVPTDEESALIAAYEGGKLSARTAKSFDLKLNTTVTKYFRNTELIVNFYGDGDEPNLKQTVERGGVTEYTFSDPTMQKEGYKLVFDYWQDRGGNKVDLYRLITDEAELDLYPHFTETPLDCRVVWVVDGKEFTDKCAFGTRPEYDVKRLGEPFKAQVGKRKYVFDGWMDVATGKKFAIGQELPIIGLSGARYEAVFAYGNYVVTWVVAGKTTQTGVEKGELPVFEGEPVKDADSLYRYIFDGWDKELTPAYGDARYEATFRREYLISSGRFSYLVTYEDGTYTGHCSAATSPVQAYNLFYVAAQKNAAVRMVYSGYSVEFSASSVYAALGLNLDRISVSVTRENAKQSYSIRFFDTDNAEIKSGIVVTLTATGNFDKENTFVTMSDGANETDVRFAFVGDDLAFTVRAGYVYVIGPQYLITVLPSDVSLIVPAHAAVGDTVTITFGELRPGTFVRSVYVLGGDGSEIAVSGTYSFVMPASAVMVGAVVADMEYTVVFKSDGKTLVTRKLKYGDTIEPPADPVKPSDKKYRYVFVGWDRELGTVTGDTVFNAVFNKEPLSEKITESRLSKLIKAAYIVLPVLLLSAIGLTVFFVIRKRKRGKKSNKS